MRPPHVKRVFVIGDIFPDSFADNIASTLCRMGISVKTASLNPLANSSKAFLRYTAHYLTRLFPAFERMLSDRLVQNVISFSPDLIISTNAGTPPSAVETIKKRLTAPFACWFTDHIASLGRQYLLAAPYDMLFLKEPFMVELFASKLSKKTFYLPEACNPTWHIPVNLTDEQRAFYEADICVAGNIYYYRALILEQLMNYKIKIWGPMFPVWLNSKTKSLFQGCYLTRLDKARAFRAARINLNTLTPAEIYGVNCRAFEIAGCGGFQIVDYKPSLEELFDVGMEIETYRTIGELKEKVAYYLNRADERDEIAHRGCLRAHKDHTYENRLNTMFTAIGA